MLAENKIKSKIFKEEDGLGTIVATGCWYVKLQGQLFRAQFPKSEPDIEGFHPAYVSLNRHSKSTQGLPA